MTIGALLVVRLGSTRLPQKGIMKILGKPMIELMIERVQNSKLVDKVVITTSTLHSDDPLENIARQLGVGCYRGPLDNVMERICGAAKAFGCDTVVELLGDNPLVHSDLIDNVIGLYRRDNLDYAASITKEYPTEEIALRLFSLGVRVQVYSRSAAERYVDYPKYIEDENRGYSAYMFEHPEVFKVGYIEAADKWGFMNRPDLNFAVNYKKNFDAVRIFFETHYATDRNFSLARVYEQLDQERYLYHLLG